MKQNKVTLVKVFEDLFKPFQYKVYYGGRGSGKSTSIAIALIIISSSSKKRILCAREMQNSIGDSVHKLLSDQIEKMGLSKEFIITATSIKSKAGSEFIFKGLRHSVSEIKSMEGLDIVWVEEAQGVSEDSWDVLMPTVRKKGSEIWISFNPENETDPTYQTFVVNPPPNSVVHKVNWSENPWISDELIKMKDHLKEVDYEKYLHVWEGETKKIADAIIFKDRYTIKEFETPDFESMDVGRYFYGADWGYANDPTVLVRCFLKDGSIWVDYEASGYQVDLDDTPALFMATVPDCHKWVINGDNARPETVSFLNKMGMRVISVKKWPGSIEDGIEHLKSFKHIYIHPRCELLAKQIGLYAYKVDKTNGDILPIAVDRNNDSIDALRYSLNGYILSRNKIKQQRFAFMGR